VSHKLIPTDAMRLTVTEATIAGTPQALLCRMIVNPATHRGISEKTLRRCFKAELELAAATANAVVANMAYAMASSGKEPAMTMFWLKTRAGWRETQITQNQQLDANGNPTNPLPAVTVIGAVTVQEAERIYLSLLG
jgi:AraC-like DNA-binding protein